MREPFGFATSAAAAAGLGEVEEFDIGGSGGTASTGQSLIRTCKRGVSASTDHVSWVVEFKSTAGRAHAAAGRGHRRPRRGGGAAKKEATEFIS
jgi:hypothetical protein